jgi:hypothetical protein
VNVKPESGASPGIPSPLALQITACRQTSPAQGPAQTHPGDGRGESDLGRRTHRQRVAKRKLTIQVSPRTVGKYFRREFRMFWTWKGCCGQPGRPSVSQETRDLIRQMSRDNPLMGRAAHPRRIAQAASTSASSTATTVRIADCKPQVLESPFADAKEQLGGCYIIEVGDLDAALSSAARCPAAVSRTVDIRPSWAHRAVRAKRTVAPGRGGRDAGGRAFRAAVANLVDRSSCGSHQLFAHSSSRGAVPVWRPPSSPSTHRVQTQSARP